MNFLSVQKLIKEHSSIYEHETPHYILLAINSMMNLKIVELLKNFPLSWNPKFHWHHKYTVCIQTGYFSNLLLILFC